MNRLPIGETGAPLILPCLRGLEGPILDRGAIKGEEGMLEGGGRFAADAYNAGGSTEGRDGRSLFMVC